MQATASATPPPPPDPSTPPGDRAAGRDEAAAPMLRTRQLAKRYGQRQAVSDISFDIAAGELLGLLGPNGAGKSTTLAMICGLTPPDGGQVSIAGHDLSRNPVACKRRIGLVTQELALVDELSALRNVALFGALHGLSGAQLMRRSAQALEGVGLAERAHERPGSFSGGMKRRLHIACALVHEPDLLLLDEPTAGVDPHSRQAIFETIEALKAGGKAILYTTHYMEEVERLADRVVIIDHGRVVAEGTQAALKARLPAALRLNLAFETAVPEPMRAAVAALPGVRELVADAGGWQLAVDDLGSTPARVLQRLAQDGIAVRQLDSGRVSLEDVFLSLTGRQLRD